MRNSQLKGLKFTAPAVSPFLFRRFGALLLLIVSKEMRERVANGRDNIVRRGYFRRTRAGVYCIWKETKEWDSLAFRVRPVRTTLFRIQHLFSSDREPCVRGIAICYPLVMSPDKNCVRRVNSGLHSIRLTSHSGIAESLMLPSHSCCSFLNPPCYYFIGLFRRCLEFLGKDYLMNEKDLSRIVESLLEELKNPEHHLSSLARDFDECGIDYCIHRIARCSCS